MPKIFEKNGFVIYVYPYEMNERHHLPHIHIYKGSFNGNSMVVEIPNLSVLANTMTASETRKAMRLIEENLEDILNKLGELK